MEIGEIIRNRFKVIENIGRGTLSEIYLAHDVALERNIAIKIFPKSLSKPVAARIQREAKIFGKLDHPLIVSLYDVFIDNGQIHLILQYIEGKNLSQKLLSSTVTIDKALSYSSDIFESLFYIHSMGIIHRDIKPSNIIIRDNDDRAILTDFNTGKSLINETNITQTGGLVGTIAYMPKEQIEGLNVSTSADVYSAGVVLFEMIFGRLPYKSNNISELVNQVRTEEISKFIFEQKELPEKIANLFLGLLSKDSDKRPSAKDAFDTIQEIFVDAQEGKSRNLDFKLEGFDTIASKIPSYEAKSVFETQMTNDELAKPTGFFADDYARHKEFNRSIEFFRSHLDHDFKTLLSQAKISFWLWFSFATISFLIIIVGVILLFQNKIVAGSITIAADILVIFIQRLFKDREEYYRNKAEVKQSHLELGNIWNLSVQSVDGISDLNLREKKLSEVIDVLMQRVKDKYFNINK
ncbi:protein kinase [candidate division KSB1 bacterium]|nr:protein kinase [candidate division KSB1 bacterium]